MKKYYFTIITILFFGLLSCSNEETKTQNQVQARPTIPITASEVRIGTQIWMTKNLNVSRYRNGDPIPQVTSIPQWRNLTTGAWCYFQNNVANGVIYGKLYNWYAVNDPRGIAPQGYHVPSDAEWTTLVTFLGGEIIAPGKLKATILWNNPNDDATNSTGFTGLPGGYRKWDGYDWDLNNVGLWWSSSAYDVNSAWRRLLFSNPTSAPVTRSYNYMKSGYSVRCLKD